MNFKKFESDQKLRGGYYTPSYLCDFISSFVIDNKCKEILEPSFGDGNFLSSALRKKKDILLNGVEINKEEFKKYKNTNKLRHNLINEDFLEWYLGNNKKKYDGIIGNPPFVRYQYLDNHSQLNSEKIFKRFNLAFTMHTNLWVPFFIASIDLLKPGGKLGMIIPNEILYLPHAKSLRSFLKLKMSKIIILDCNELLFENTLQGTSVIFATKKIHDKEKSYLSINRLKKDLLHKDNTNKIIKDSVFKEIGNEEKWMIYLLNNDEIKALNYLKNKKEVKTFSDIASTDVGIVTGANKFFLINKETVHKYKLEKYMHPMFGKSNHCKGVIFDAEQHKKNIEKNNPSFFLSIKKDTKINLALKKYLKIGEKEELQKRYKCSVREPWYSVPSVYSTSLALLKRSHKFPRLIFNKVKAYTTDTAYRIKSFDIEEEKLSFCFINSLTALTAELEGRHYGGGVLELTPSEIERLLIPIPTKLKFNIENLNKEFFENKDENTILTTQNSIISKSLKIDLKYFKIIHKALLKLQKRRFRNEQ